MAFEYYLFNQMILNAAKAPKKDHVSLFLVWEKRKKKKVNILFIIIWGVGVTVHFKLTDIRFTDGFMPTYCKTIFLWNFH